MTQKPVDDAIDMLLRALLKIANNKDTPLDKRLDILDKSMKWVAIKHKVDGTDTGEGSAINGYSEQLDTTAGKRNTGKSAGARISKAAAATERRILRDAKRGPGEDAGPVPHNGNGAGGESAFAVGRAERIPPVGLNGHGPDHPATEDDNGGGV